MHTFDLLIFDCDGVLVDSEIIACRVAAETLTAIGYPMDPRVFVEQKSGYMMDDVIAEIGKKTGSDLLARFDMNAYRQNVIAALAKELAPMPGVKETVAELKMPMCVASGSSVERNTVALNKVGLFSFFQGCIFSSHEVKKGKPAPDILFYAAEKMGADPARCLVVEDSEAGIKAAKTAGMTVFGFMGASHISPFLRERAQKAGPDLMFDDMRQLPELMERYEISRKSHSRVSGNPAPSVREAFDSETTG